MNQFVKARECNQAYNTSLLRLLFFLSVTGSVHSLLLSELPIVSAFFHALREQYYPKVSSKFMNEYDYIVVGAGSGGSVVASRLSEIPCVNVLLLEAGDEPPLLTEVPVLALAGWFSHVDWQFKSVPQRHTGVHLINREFVLPAGKMLGGTSSLNNMLYVRGNKKNFDDWAKQGCEGWSYEEVLPYFLKLEGNRGFPASEYHNTTGPVTIENSSYNPELKTILQKAIKGLGYDIIDSNAERQTGFYDLQGNTRDRKRCSTAKAYLIPAEKRSNLHIVSNAMVKRVLIKRGRAVGVEFEFRDKTYQVKATEEVIVSAGAVKSPQILMLSGVGPKEELDKCKIPVHADLPVGKNFHDHASILMPYELGSDVEPIWKKLLNPLNLIKYMTEKSGPYASLTMLHYLAFLKGTLISPQVDEPNFELQLGEITALISGAKFYGIKKEVYDAWLGSFNPKPILMCLVTQAQPWSRGTITLNSTNIHDSPLIDPNYLADPRDWGDLLDGMKVCQSIAKTRDMRKIGTKSITSALPGCEKYSHNEDLYFICMLHHLVNSAHHRAGSVKMGDPNDPTTVLDPQLRVKGIRGLRVVDASVMPSVTSGNTNIPVIMIAEKASDMIKETINCRQKRRRMKCHRKVISPEGGEAVIEAVNNVEQSLNMLQSALDELFAIDALKKEEESLIKSLKNPLELLDVQSKTSFQKQLKEIASSLSVSVASGFMDLIELFK